MPSLIRRIGSSANVALTANGKSQCAITAYTGNVRFASPLRCCWIELPKISKDAGLRAFVLAGPDVCFPINDEVDGEGARESHARQVRQFFPGVRWRVVRVEIF